uniref:Uncharacterized protein n=1 Tax=viral metagenome TaxID=1070528 RepID=A0A6C0JKW6_9ZZZZ
MSKQQGEMGNLLTTFTQSPELVLADKFFIGLIFIGVIIKLLGSIGIESLGQATASLWGYNVILFSLIGIMILKLDTSEYVFMKQIKDIPLYLFVLAILIVWVIILNVKFYKVINEKSLPGEYYTWNNWSTYVLLAIIIIITYIFYAKQIKKNPILTPTFESDTSTILYFILFINFIIVGIQNTILQNFAVEG